MSSENVVKGGDIDEEKFVGGKKKNGHKMDCMCRICKNMAAKAKRHGYTDDELKKQERKKGNKKANGHRLNCHCPICKNMDKHKKGKRGGDNHEEYEEKDTTMILEHDMDNMDGDMIAGKKMNKYSKKSKKRKSRKSKKSKKNRSRKTRK